MEREASSEDVKWCSSPQGITRSGTELGLQELFKGLSNIPSVGSYLAQFGENNTATPTDERPHYSLPEESQVTAGGISVAESSVPQLSQLQGSLTGDAFSGGLNRVPSLEFLKMFFGSSNTLYSPALPLARTIQDAQSGNSGGYEAPAVINGVNSIPTTVAVQQHPQGGVIPPAPNSALLAMNPAAALQFSQFTSAGLLPQGIDLEFLEKTEQRRARRMLSNRESARRSRKRKQEHLQTLENEIHRLQKEKSSWLESRETMKRRCMSAEDECARLKEENTRLRDELSILSMVRAELLSSRKSLSVAKENEKEPEK